MPTTINLSVGSGETKTITFNCGGTFVTDDIQYVITGSGGDTNTTLSGVAYSDSTAGYDKTASLPGFSLSSGQTILLWLKNSNTKSSAKLNINSTGGKTIKIDGTTNTNSTNFPAGYWLCSYNGTYWNVYRVQLSFDDITSKPTTISGYGITDASVSGQTVSIGGSSVTVPTNTNELTNGAGFTTNTGTVTSVGLTNATNGGLTISGSPITGSGSITVGHTNVLNSAQTTQAVYPIKIDKNGHISDYGEAVTIPTISGVNNGTNWTSITINGITKNIPSDTNTTLSGIAVCGSGASTTTKEGVLPGFELTHRQVIFLNLETANTASNATLNVNNTGAKTIKIDGTTNTNSTNFPAGWWWCLYNSDSNFWNVYRLGIRFSDLTAHPNSISGYGITDASISGSTITLGSDTLTLPSYSLVFGNISSTTNTANVTNSNVFINLVKNGNAVSGGVNISGINGISVVTADDATEIWIDGSGCGGSDTNYYPTAMSWTDGSSDGPTGTITMSGTSNISIGAFPSAGPTKSGVVTTGQQTFNGVKIFSSSPKLSSNAISTSSGYTQTFPNATGTIVNGTGTSGYLAKWNGTNSITQGPQLGSSTTTFLRNDGTWATPSGGGGGSVVSAASSEMGIEGYRVGSITIDGNTTYFKVSPARAVTSYIASYGYYSCQGVVRPLYEVVTAGGESEDFTSLADYGVSDAPSVDEDYIVGGNVTGESVYIPITVIYRYNTQTSKYESIPCLKLPKSFFDTTLAKNFGNVVPFITKK